MNNKTPSKNSNNTNSNSREENTSSEESNSNNRTENVTPANSTEQLDREVTEALIYSPSLAEHPSFAEDYSDLFGNPGSSIASTSGAFFRGQSRRPSKLDNPETTPSRVSRRLQGKSALNTQGVQPFTRQRKGPSLKTCGIAASTSSTPAGNRPEIRIEDFNTPRLAVNLLQLDEGDEPLPPAPFLFGPNMAEGGGNGVVDGHLDGVGDGVGNVGNPGLNLNAGNPGDNQNVGNAGNPPQNVYNPGDGQGDQNQNQGQQNGRNGNDYRGISN